MNKIIALVVLSAVVATPAIGTAGIFGRRTRQPAGYSGSYQGGYQTAPAPSQPVNPGNYRSYSYQPTYQSAPAYQRTQRSNIYPFDSRANPRDWTEAHRGYGVKIRGW